MYNYVYVASWSTQASFEPLGADFREIAYNSVNSSEVYFSLEDAKKATFEKVREYFSDLDAKIVEKRLTNEVKTKVAELITHQEYECFAKSTYADEYLEAFVAIQRKQVM